MLIVLCRSIYMWEYLKILLSSFLLTRSFWTEANVQTLPFSQNILIQVRLVMLFYYLERGFSVFFLLFGAQLLCFFLLFWSAASLFIIIWSAASLGFFFIIWSAASLFLLFGAQLLRLFSEVLRQHSLACIYSLQVH